MLTEIAVQKFDIDMKGNELETKAIAQLTENLHEPPSATVADDGKKYVKCEICQKSMTSASRKRHMRSHLGERRYSCHTCGLAFSDSGNLARHTRALHAKQRPHVCPICQKSFSRNGHLQDHVKSHSENREFVCDSCGKASKSSAALRMHKRIHSSSCKFECMECGARFKRGGELRAHVSVHTGERRHRCHCGRAFRLRAQLRRHRCPRSATFASETRAPPPAYRADLVPEACPNCPKCPAGRTHEDNVDDLCDEHSELYFQCGECENYIVKKQFYLHMSLHASHYASIREEAEKRAEETKDVNGNTKTEKAASPPATVSKAIVIKITPEKTTATRATRNARNEFSDHSDTDGFDPLPDSVFEAIEDSQDGQRDAEPSRSRNAERNFECTVCGQKFVQQSRLDRHMASHDVDKGTASDTSTDRTIRSAKFNKRTRKCPTCDKEYTASSSYFYHIKYGHEPARDKACDACGRKFATDTCLRQHKASVHAKERSFKCEFCPKAFRSRASLYIHSQTHTGSKLHACSQCPLSFRWRTHLARHSSRHAAERRHACARCGRAFAVRCDLLRHARTHAPAAHVCAHCGACFAQLRYLKVHVARKHGGDPPAPPSVASDVATKNSTSTCQDSSDGSELCTKYTRY